MLSERYIKMRWAITFWLLRMARKTAVKQSDWGDKLTLSIDRFVYYTKHGRLPGGRRGIGL